MQIKEIWPDDPLLEANIKSGLRKAAAAGALGTGLMFGHGMTTDPVRNTPAFQAQTLPSDDEDLSRFVYQPPADPEHAGELLKRKPGELKDPEQAGAILTKPMTGKKPVDAHDNFPPTLWNQPKASANEKMQAFVFTFDPLIDKANNRILADRRYLLSIINPKHHLNDDERQWLDEKMSKYNAANVNDLLQKMDIVPKGMALAQGALESGWGSSSLARKSNAFFGMISGVGGFSSYRSPQDSVNDYVHNLNTHPAYKDFRLARAKAREERQKLNSWQLIGHLGRYSERGQAYINHVKSMMASPWIKDVDEGRHFVKY